MRKLSKIKEAHDLFGMLACEMVPTLKGKFPEEIMNDFKQISAIMCWVMKCDSSTGNIFKKRLAWVREIIKTAGFELGKEVVATSGDKNEASKIQEEQKRDVAKSARDLIRQHNEKLHELRMTDRDLADRVQDSEMTLKQAIAEVESNQTRSCPNCGNWHPPKSPHWASGSVQTWEEAVSHCSEALQIRAMAFLTALSVWPDNPLDPSYMEDYFQATITPKAEQSEEEDWS